MSEIDGLFVDEKHGEYEVGEFENTSDRRTLIVGAKDLSDTN